MPDEVHDILKFAIDADLSATNIVLALSPALRDLQDTPAEWRDLTCYEVASLIPVLVHTIANLTGAIETVVADGQDNGHREKARLVQGGIRLLRQGEAAIWAAEASYELTTCMRSRSQEVAALDFPGGSLTAAPTVSITEKMRSVQRGYRVEPSPVLVEDDHPGLAADLDADADVVDGEDSEARLKAAAVAAYRFSVSAGTPLSQRKLAEMFGRSRQWARIRIAAAMTTAMAGPAGSGREKDANSAVYRLPADISTNGRKP